jgi:hypothetical protein
MACRRSGWLPESSCCSVSSKARRLARPTRVGHPVPDSAAPTAKVFRIGADPGASIAISRRSQAEVHHSAWAPVSAPGSARSGCSSGTGRTGASGSSSVSFDQCRLRKHGAKREKAQRSNSTVTNVVRCIMRRAEPPPSRSAVFCKPLWVGRPRSRQSWRESSIGWGQCRELAGSPGEAAHTSLVRQVLCRGPREVAGGGRAAENATRQKPRWESGPLMRF